MIDASWYQKPPAIKERLGAGGVIVRFENNHALIAMVREGVNSEDQRCVLPKGGVDPGEDIETAARREIEEEAGLRDLILIQKLAVLERLNFRKTRWQQTHYFLYYTHQVEGQPSDPHINYVLEWHGLDQLEALFWPEQRQLIQDHQSLIDGLRSQFG